MGKFKQGIAFQKLKNRLQILERKVEVMSKTDEAFKKALEDVNTATSNLGARITAAIEKLVSEDEAEDTAAITELKTIAATLNSFAPTPDAPVEIPAASAAGDTPPTEDNASWNWNGIGGDAVPDAPTEETPAP